MIEIEFYFIIRTRASILLKATTWNKKKK